MTQNQPYHIPALLAASVDYLNVRPEGVYADATFGGGGHSREILRRLGQAGRLYGFDQDLDATVNIPDDPRFTFVHSNFRYMQNFLDYHDALPADGIIADLGVSFHHFDSAERGFSFRAEAPLDMRMNRNAALTAATIVNEYTEQQLTDLLRSFTDLKRPERISRLIAQQRVKSPLSTTTALLQCVEPALNPRQLKKDAAQVFQALRIEVNAEMEALERFLQSTLSILRPGGRFVVLTYHSIEDRMVKNFMKSGNTAGNVEKDFYGRTLTPWKVLTRTPVSASTEEIELNPRARSAKLRAAELIEI